MGALAFLLWELDSNRGTTHLSRFYGNGPPAWAIYKALLDGSIPTIRSPA